MILGTMIIFIVFKQTCKTDEKQTEEQLYGSINNQELPED